jgi:hypothetical protein
MPEKPMKDVGIVAAVVLVLCGLVFVGLFVIFATMLNNALPGNNK